MSALDNIPISVIPAGEEGAPAQDNARAILHQLEAMLEVLATEGRADGIDLRRLPLSPEDWAKLRQVLGEGEVSAVLEALGQTRIRETAVPGVWWVTHCNGEGDVVTETIEVTECPSILLASKMGLPVLRARLLRLGVTGQEPRE